MTNQIPIVDYLVLGNPPHLRAHGCDACDALYLDRRNACARCSGRDFSSRTLSNSGRVRAFTVVHRAAPSIPTPYTSVVVDLDGGGAVKANLLDTTEPAEITPDLRVELTTFVMGTDDDGTEAVGFGYCRQRGQS
jgi:uncharacterized OB-fold protein